jgi:hypothetical protein
MLTAFGSVTVALMMVSYWLEPRSKWFVLLFAAASAGTSAYSGLVAAYPITVIEGVWTFIALGRFLQRGSEEAQLR